MLAPDPDKIIVPRKQGEILFTPGGRALIGDLGKGERDRGADRRFADAFGSSRGELRAAAREGALAAILRHATAIGDSVSLSASKPWIITGHQVEFYHAGVWAKVIAADAVAKRCGGAAIDLLVDHDLADEMGMEIPAKDGGGEWRRERVEFAEASALPVESLRVPGAAEIARWKRALGEFPAAGSDAMRRFKGNLEDAPAGGGAGESYVLWMSRARRRFEKSFALDVAHVPTTAVCAGPAWEAFVGAWIRHAGEWTAVYNRCLAEYRRRQGIKAAAQPMPDLLRDLATGTFELPFWIYRAGEPRGRMMVRERSGVAIAIVSGREIPVDGDFLSGRAGFLVRPRALTLTMFVRMFLADVFIHGIGGALYDQITDAMMLELFGEDSAASYGCVSAAWLLPLDGDAEDAESVSGIKWRLHHLMHNPQLAVARPELGGEIERAIEKRAELVERIAASLATDRSGGRMRRREWFTELHEINGRIHALVPGALDDLRKRLAAAQWAARQRKVTHWREWFFGLHSIRALEELVDKIEAIADA